MRPRISASKAEAKTRSKEMDKLWRSRNKERVQRVSREYYLKNREAILAKAKLTKKHQSEKIRSSRLLKLYGLTLAEYQAKVASQNNLCAICSKQLDLVVDHDHSTGKVRELLCNPCNRGLGQFKDNFELLLLAAQYLHKHSGII